jgi:poly(3-hydroxybutyrate) depolymerase
MDYERFLDRQFVMTDAGRIDRVRDLYTTFNPKVDLDALKACGYLDALADMMQPMLDYRDDHSPANVAYWAKRGMVKEFHGEDEPMSWTEYEMKTGYRWEDPDRQGPQNRCKRWNSFVPVSAFRPENKGRKYPVVVVLHGGFNPISIIDGWGFPQEAARREWIVIVPSIELDDILDEILAEAKKLYPVDESRIYATGFSYGGLMSNILGNKRPDVYAAVGPCGMPIDNGFTDKPFGPEPQTPFDGVPRAPAMGTYMPVINMAGNLDGFRFPLYDSKDWRTGKPNAGALVDGINSWARVNRAPEVSLEAVMALKGREDVSGEEKHMGMPIAPDCRRTVVADGITHHIADLRSQDGVARVRIVCSMNMPHWPTPEMARQVFGFFSRFSRDPATKESLYTP